MILFLHGLAGYGGEWRQVWEHLDESVGVLAPDLRGHGDSRGEPEFDVDLSSFLSDALTLIEELASGRVVVVGQSMGGLVAMGLAAQRPDLVEHLVLIEAGVRPMTEAEFSELQAWFDRWPASFTDRDEALAFFGVDRPSSTAWVDGLAVTHAGLRPRFDVGSMMRTMRALASTSGVARLSEITVPITLVKGSGGGIGDEEIAEMVVVQPDLGIVVIEDSGHDVHLDQPGAVAAILGRIT